MQQESDFQMVPNWPQIRKMTIGSKFAYIMSSWNSLDVVLFLFSSLVTRPSFMSVSWLALELWKFSFIGDWAEICVAEKL